MTGAAPGPTVGVEEEFLLVDPATGFPVPRAGEVIAAARERFGLDLDHELLATQVEIKTSVCRDAEQVRRELAGMRRAVAAAAREAGCRALAVGAPPIGEPEGAIVDEPRYRAILRTYGALARQQSICGCHVHVAVPDGETAVQVCNHLRLRLPVLAALMANSPFARGQDTGHASWRSVVWSRWPAAGPPPYLTSWRHYQALCDLLLDSGAISDPAMVYWDVRPSSRLPTVEVRVADVAVTAGEAALLAALVRALVTTAVADVRRGALAAPVPGEVLRLACWRAARDGLAGSAVDVLSDRLLPARRLVGALVRRVGPALAANGDLGLVERAMARLDRLGCGADRQRRAFAGAGRMADVLDAVALDGPGEGPGGTAVEARPADPGGVAVVRVVGEVDTPNGDAMARRCAEAVDSGADEVVLDLTGVTSFGPCGVAALARARGHGAARGVPVGVVAGHEVRRVLRAEAVETAPPPRPDAEPAR